jgi:hypothetical protein
MLFQRKARIVLGTCFLILISACTVKKNVPQITPPVTPLPGSAASLPTVLPENTAPVETAVSSGSTPSVTEPLPAGPSPIVTSSLPLASDWRDAPIMPEITPHVLQIYRDGQLQGRDPHGFSVIGDCQAVPFVFMGPFERGELSPDQGESYLWDAVAYFKGSFTRWGMAVRGGFTAASLLTPMQADPHYCKSGETPLTCEYRLHNPAFVFVTLETWLYPKTVDRYDGYLRRIMDYVIAHGSVPILLTKADSSELRNGTHVFNPVIIQVAHDYDVPVVNFWRAAQYLDNSGIDPTREGFHLSQDGYNLKNILALRTLYNVWQYIETSGVAGELPGNGTAAVPTPAPQVDSSPTAPPTPQVVLPSCQGGCIFYALAGSVDGAVNMQGVYAYSYSDKKKTQVLGSGYNLQDVSQDGKRLLVNNSSSLFEINLSDSSVSLVSDSFFAMGKQGAYWNSDDSRIIYLDDKAPLKTQSGSAFNFFPSPLDDERYFESGACTSQDFCQSGGVFRLNSDGTVAKLDSYSKLVFSPDGNWFSFLNPASATSENYYHINYLLVEDAHRGISSRRVFYLPDEHGFMVYPDVRQVAFSPDSRYLFILDDVYSAYFENSLRLQTYMVDLETGILYNFGKIAGTSGSFKPQLVWSPQGDKLLFFLTSMTADNKYSLSIYQTILNTTDRLVLYDQDILNSGDYFYITNIYWR